MRERRLIVGHRGCYLVLWKPRHGKAFEALDNLSTISAGHLQIFAVKLMFMNDSEMILELFDKPVVVVVLRGSSAVYLDMECRPQFLLGFRVGLHQVFDRIDLRLGKSIFES